MKVMGYEVGDERKLVAYGKVMNVEGKTLHRITIYEGCISMEMQNSEDNEYILSKVSK